MFAVGLFVGDGIFHFSGQCIVTSKSIVGASRLAELRGAPLAGVLGCTWSPAAVGATGHLNGDGCNGLPDRPRAAFASALFCQPPPSPSPPPPPPPSL